MKMFILTWLAKGFLIGLGIMLSIVGVLIAVSLLILCLRAIVFLWELLLDFYDYLID